MTAKDAHEGTRIAFHCEIDGQMHTGIVGRHISAFAARRRVWYVDVTLDNPNEKTGPGVALPELHTVYPERSLAA